MRRRENGRREGTPDNPIRTSVPAEVVAVDGSRLDFDYDPPLERPQRRRLVILDFRTLGAGDGWKYGGVQGWQDEGINVWLDEVEQEGESGPDQTDQ